MELAHPILFYLVQNDEMIKGDNNLKTHKFCKYSSHAPHGTYI